MERTSKNPPQMTLIIRYAWLHVEAKGIYSNVIKYSNIICFACVKSMWIKNMCGLICGMLKIICCGTYLGYQKYVANKKNCVLIFLRFLDK